MTSGPLHVTTGVTEPLQDRTSGLRFFSQYVEQDHVSLVLGACFQGIVLTGAAVAFVTHQHDRIVRVLAHAVRGRRWLAVRLGLAHPTARKLRTGLTVAMCALVVFTLSFDRGTGAPETREMSPTWVV